MKPKEHKDFSEYEKEYREIWKTYQENDEKLDRTVIINGERAPWRGQDFDDGGLRKRFIKDLKGLKIKYKHIFKDVSEDTK